MAPAEARWHCLPDTGRIFSARTHGSLFIVQRVVAVFLLFRHEGKFGVAFDNCGVEGGELVASLILACADQQFVGQVGTATQGTDGLSSPIIAAISGIFLRHRTGRRPESADPTPVCAEA